MKFRALSAFAFVVPFFLPNSSVAASATSRALRRVAAQIAATAGSPSQERPALAVLPLRTSDRLEKRRVDFAFEELLVHELSQTGRFRLVERSAVEAILAEQKFQQTGAIDSSQAVKVGSLTGARLVALGSVEKVGRVYQLNARVVDVQNGEVAATAFEEIPVTEFEQDAAPYLQLVPDAQTLGFYVAYIAGPKGKDAKTVSIGGPSNATVQGKEADLKFVGGGVRYSPVKRVWLDLAFFTTADNSVVGVYSDSFRTISMDLESSSAIRVLVAYAVPQKRLGRWTVGFGAMRYNLSASSVGADTDIEVDETSLFARAGFELRLQERVGLGLHVNHAFNDVDASITGHSESPFSLGRLSFEPSLAVYF